MSDLIATIHDHLGAAMLVICRFGGLMIFGPLLSAPIIPARVRVFLSFMLGLAVYPLLSTTVLPPEPVELSLISMAPMAAMEVTLGGVIGFLASLPLVAAQTGGLVMGQQMGLGFARFYNPGMDDESDVVGQMLFFLAMGGFLIIGGHEAMIHAVLHSFQHVPLGGFTPDTDLLALANGMLLASFELAMRVAAPLLALIFLETIAMGFVAKTVPQLNILSLGFPIRIMAGVFIIAVGLVAIDEVLMEGAADLLDAIFGWLESTSATPPH